jgi:hypothetical protein
MACGDTTSTDLHGAGLPVRDLELESLLAAYTDSRLRRSTIREVFLHLALDDTRGRLRVSTAPGTRC